MEDLPYSGNWDCQNLVMEVCNILWVLHFQKENLGIILYTHSSLGSAIVN